MNYKNSTRRHVRQSREQSAFYADRACDRRDAVQTIAHNDRFQAPTLPYTASRTGPATISPLAENTSIFPVFSA